MPARDGWSFFLEQGVFTQLSGVSIHSADKRADLPGNWVAGEVDPHKLLEKES
jgi:hypothetical protein